MYVRRGEGWGQSGSIYVIYQTSPLEQRQITVIFEEFLSLEAIKIDAFPDKRNKMIKTHVYSSIYFSTTILIFFDKFYDLCMSFQFYVILHVWASGTQEIVRSEWFREREVFSYKGRYPLRGKSPRTSIVSLQFFIDDLAGYGNFCN